MIEGEVLRHEVLVPWENVCTLEEGVALSIECVGWLETNVGGEEDWVYPSNWRSGIVGGTLYAHFFFRDLKKATMFRLFWG